MNKIEPHRKFNKKDVGSSINNDIKIAKELGYPKSIINKLQNEPNASKRQLILRIARLGGDKND